jgi:hypothetical protein
MKVRFDATLDDFIDIGLRSSGPKRQRIIGGIVAGLVVGGLLANLGYQITGEIFVFGTIFAAGFIGTFAGLVRLPKKNLETFYRKRFGIIDSVPYEVDISDEGFRASAFGQTSLSDWKLLEDIFETDDAIYFRNTFGMYAAVRKRGFADHEEMNEFLVLARRYWSDATVPKPPSFEESNY